MMKNNKGLTLVEVLVVLALLSMVILLINSVQLFGAKQLANQSQDAQNQANVRLAVNIISKEIRMSDPKNVGESNGVLTINGDVYKHNNEHKTITKNDQPLIEGIEEFDSQLNGKKLLLTIKSIENDLEQSVDISTVIYIR